MKFIFAFFSLFFITTTLAQDYAKVDARVAQYPKRITSPDALATQIQKDFTDERERVRAIYTWLALNISYDMQDFLYGDRSVKFSYRDQQDLLEKQRAIREYSIEKTLRTNKAICEGYAQTLKKVCDLMKIHCLFIDGYSKTSVSDIGKKPQRGDHAWNAVKIKNKWYVLDVTWGAGRARGNTWKKNFNDYFFFTDPDEFVKTHLPSVEGLSFANKEPSKTAFFDAPAYAVGYFKNKLQLRAPQTGKIRLKRGENISFKMRAISEDVKLSYATKEDMRLKPLSLDCQSDDCTFQVPVTATKNTDLFIVANRETALQFKIEVE